MIGTTTSYSFLPGHHLTTSYGYDAASNRTGFTDPQGGTVAYGYDALNRLTSLNSSVAGLFGFGYDDLSRRTSLTRPNGVATSYGYDNLSRLLSVLHQQGGVTIDGDSYTYDNAGNRITKANNLDSSRTGGPYLTMTHWCPISARLWQMWVCSITQSPTQSMKNSYKL